MSDTLEQARRLDDADPLAHLRSRFLGVDDPSVVAYFDGNSLGRPLVATAERMDAFVREQWGGRLTHRQRRGQCAAAPSRR